MFWFSFSSIRVVVTVEQTEQELDKAASLLKEAAQSVLNQTAVLDYSSPNYQDRCLTLYSDFTSDIQVLPLMAFKPD